MRDPLLQPGSASAETRLDVLYKQHHRRLTALAGAIMLDRSLAEEIVHDAFVGLSGRIDEVANPEGYLQRSVINLAGRVVKQRGRALPSRPIETSSIPDIDDTWTVVATLPVQQRAVLVLRFWEDLSQPQIAHVLDIPVGTVKSTLHRALAAVQTALDQPPTPREQ